MATMWFVDRQVYNLRVGTPWSGLTLVIYSLQGIRVFLCFKRDVTELAACKKPIEGDAWKRLLDHYKSNPVVDDGLPTGYICDYCIK